MILSPSRARAVIAVSFNFSEHCCAIGYALSEFAVEHSHLFLDIFSAVLLAALIVMGMLKAVDHYRRVSVGYRLERN